MTSWPLALAMALSLLARHFASPLYEALLLRRSVRFLERRPRFKQSFEGEPVSDSAPRPSDAQHGALPIDLRVSASARTVFVSYSQGVEALEWAEGEEDDPAKVQSLGTIPPQPSPEQADEFWLFLEQATSWVAADLTFDREAQLSLLAPDARCFGFVGAENIVQGNMELSKTTIFAMTHPIVIHLEQRVVTWDFDIIDRGSGKLRGRGTDVVHVSEQGRIAKVDTLRHLRFQPSWVQKQIMGDPLADMAASRVPESILPPGAEAARIGAVPRQMSYAPIYSPYSGVERRPRVQHPAIFGDAVPVLEFGPTTAAAARTVVVMAEWWGVDSGILDFARSLTVLLGPGTRTVVPNFYRDSVVPVDMNWGVEDVQQRGMADAGHKMANTNWQEVIADVEAIVAASRGPVALIGFSYGAVAALLAAQRCNVACVVAWYGAPDKKYTGGAAELFDASRILCPVQLQWAAQDKVVGFSDVATGKRLAESLRVVEYNEDAGDHGFFNDRLWWTAWKASLVQPRPPYSPELAAGSLDKSLAFLRQHLELGRIP